MRWINWFDPKVYISGGRPLFVLSDAQKEEVIAQADSHLKTAKGRGYRRQVTRAEVIQLLSGLPRDDAGLVSFHDAQKLIMGYREKQIARFKVIFPEIAAGMGKKKQPRGTKPPPGVAELDAGKTRTDTANRRKKAGPSLSATEGTSMARSCGAEVGGGGGVSRRAKFSADVAPAEMFIKDAGLTPAGVASHVREAPMLLPARGVDNVLAQKISIQFQKIRLFVSQTPWKQQRAVARLVGYVFHFSVPFVSEFTLSMYMYLAILQPHIMRHSRRTRPPPSISRHTRPDKQASEYSRVQGWQHSRRKRPWFDAKREADSRGQAARAWADDVGPLLLPEGKQHRWSCAIREELDHRQAQGLK